MRWIIVFAMAARDGALSWRAEYKSMAQSPAQKKTLTGLVGGGPAASLSFTQFDSALGTLTGVTLSVTTTLSGSVSVENLDLAPVQLAAGLQASLLLNGAYIYQSIGTATASGAATLAAFDGNSDFAGASGTVLSGLSGTNTETVSIPIGIYAIPYFSGFSGFNLTAYPAAGLGLSAGANLRMQSAVATIDAEVSLTYDYTPASGAGGAVVTTINTGGTTLSASLGAPASTFTTARQTREVAAQTTGWTSALTVDGFDPTWGTLVSVNLRLANTLTSSIAFENHGASYGNAVATQHLVTTLSVAGQPASLLTAQAENVDGLYFGLPDGTDDFAGSGGWRNDNLSNQGSISAHLTDPATLASFLGTGPIDLSLHAAGTGILQGSADLLAEFQASSSAKLDISYTFAPPGPHIPIAMTNATTGQQTQPTPAAYDGPVPGIVNEFAMITPDNIALSAATDSWYIRTGPGTDAIRVANGTNVLDGGGGSNFLTGGEGQDTFFVDASVIPGPMWNTIANFTSGDAATIWGITPEGFRLTWLDGLGAPGATGLTLNARAPGTPLVSTTFAGYITADLYNGRLEITYGSASDLPYMNIRAV